MFKELHQVYNQTEWLFVDEENLKALLLQNRKKNLSVPIAHAVNTKEIYETMLEYIGSTNNCCVLSLWNSHANALHYKQKHWPSRKNTVVVKANIKYDPIVKRENIILPSLHIKKGLLKTLLKKRD